MAFQTSLVLFIPPLTHPFHQHLKSPLGCWNEPWVIFWHSGVPLCLQQKLVSSNPWKERFFPPSFCPFGLCVLTIYLVHSPTYLECMPIYDFLYDCKASWNYYPSGTWHLGKLESVFSPWSLYRLVLMSAWHKLGSSQRRQPQLRKWLPKIAL